ncbi:hypothetical protein L0664_04655 [Octadecabacter sp. G9-8]|uniref:Uncharacterized protein n=1 Tax=Octadecabacter dasysiphoniae TaxID=2909341 RepID=A0ABS9CWD4_9RHOB|nr:hypothetical protein [Octadecabacter dasysiphoniae]MCF2870348.1 hypothetical protein [Octadecabacter dasysiphoniae]
MFKTLAIAAAALAACATCATFASADSYISNFAGKQENPQQVELGTVRADGNGVVEVYTFHKGEIGALIGSEPVRAGANLDVSVDINRANTDAIAILKINGEIVDTQELEFN